MSFGVPVWPTYGQSFGGSGSIYGYGQELYLTGFSPQRPIDYVDWLQYGYANPASYAPDTSRESVQSLIYGDYARPPWTDPRDLARCNCAPYPPQFVYTAFPASPAPRATLPIPSPDLTRGLPTRVVAGVGSCCRPNWPRPIVGGLGGFRRSGPVAQNPVQSLASMLKLRFSTVLNAIGRTGEWIAERAITYARLMRDSATNVAIGALAIMLSAPGVPFRLAAGLNATSRTVVPEALHWFDDHLVATKTLEPVIALSCAIVSGVPFPTNAAAVLAAYDAYRSVAVVLGQLAAEDQATRDDVKFFVDGAESVVRSADPDGVRRLETTWRGAKQIFEEFADDILTRCAGSDARTCVRDFVPRLIEEPGARQIDRFVKSSAPGVPEARDFVRRYERNLDALLLAYRERRLQEAVGDANYPIWRTVLNDIQIAERQGDVPEGTAAATTDVVLQLADSDQIEMQASHAAVVEKVTLGGVRRVRSTRPGYVQVRLGVPGGKKRKG